MSQTQIRTDNLHRIPVYDVRLVKSRRALRLAEISLDNPYAASRALHALIGLTDREHFACLFLNGRCDITGAHIVAIGGQHEIGTVDRRAILRAALAACSSSMILSHNHPSGDPTPSPEDLEMTATLMRAANIVGVPVVDHVIVTREPGRFHSMYDRGTLPKLDEDSERPARPERNTVVEIERELAEQFSTARLDRYAERLCLAEWIAERGLEPAEL